jgi:hypothetical protein
MNTARSPEITFDYPQAGRRMLWVKCMLISASIRPKYKGSWTSYERDAK